MFVLRLRAHDELRENMAFRLAKFYRGIAKPLDSASLALILVTLASVIEGTLLRRYAFA